MTNHNTSFNTHMTDNKQSYGSIDTVNLNSSKKDGKHGYRMIFITLVVLLVAVGGILVSQRENLQQILKGKTEEPISENKPAGKVQVPQAIDVPTSTIKDRQVPWLEIVSMDGSALPVGGSKTLYVKGTSDNRDITGYDMLIAYDPTALEIVSAKSAMQDYEIFKFDRGDHMTITGIKNFQKREPVTFNGGNLLEIVVKAKKQGNTVVSLNSTMGQEKTQLVDSEVKVIEPQIGSIQLEVQ